MKTSYQLTMLAYAELKEQNKKNAFFKEHNLTKEKVEDFILKPVMRSGKYYVNLTLANEDEYFCINNQYKNIPCFTHSIYVTIEKLDKKFKIYGVKNGDDLYYKDMLINYMYSLRTTYKEFLYDDCILDEEDSDKNYLSGGEAGLYITLSQNDIKIDYVLEK